MHQNMTFDEYKTKCNIQNHNITDLMNGIYDVIATDEYKEEFKKGITDIFDGCKLVRNYGFLAPETLPYYCEQLWLSIHEFLIDFSADKEGDWIQQSVDLWNNKN